MSHCLITGMTMSGKTTLARELSSQYRARGIKCAVLDPINDVKWRHVADYVTDNESEFMDVVMSSESCAVFVDEAGEKIGQYGREFFTLATRARHLGHRSHFITQRPSQISPTVRDQCDRIYLFALNGDACKTLSKDWNKPDLMAGTELDKGEYITAPRFGPIRKGRIF